MSERKLFKVLYGYGSGVSRDASAGVPRFIPWEVAETFRDQAHRNHSQTLERLNERGGLSPLEMYSAHTRTKFPSPITFEHHRAANLWLWSVAVPNDAK